MSKELSSSTLFSRWRKSILLFFAVMGPGLITSAVDNDACGIATYSIAGASTGLSLIWTLLPITILLIFTQEMCARMGIVTGKGLSDLLRENFGLRITFLVLILLLAANYGNIVAEFAGIAESGELFNVSKFISVPAAAIIVFLLVLKGSYLMVERVFLTASLFYICYIVSGMMALPSDLSIILEAAIPKLPRDNVSLTVTIALIGTTVAPWMQFYLQAAVVEKGISQEDYKMERLDVILGSIVTVVIAFFIIGSCAMTMYTHGISVSNAGEAAKALAPLAGEYASALFGFGLLFASLFAACILPLSTAYCVCEGLGFETGLDNSFNEAPEFYSLYTFLIVFGAASVLIPGLPLMKVMYYSQVINGLLLPVVLIFILLLINKTELMGNYRNKLIGNTIGIILTIIISGLGCATIFYS